MVDIAKSIFLHFFMLISELALKDKYEKTSCPVTQHHSSVRFCIAYRHDSTADAAATAPKSQIRSPHLFKPE